MARMLQEADPARGVTPDRQAVARVAQRGLAGMSPAQLQVITDKAARERTNAAQVCEAAIRFFAKPSPALATMPSKLSIFWPVFALAAWTGCVLVLIAVRRVVAGVSVQVHPREYALGESCKVPAQVSLPNRNYMNLLELPVLFYVVCIVAFVTATTGPILLILAWSYVALRVVYSLIHVTYNHVMHRFAAFAASNMVLVVMWLTVGLALAHQA